MRRSRATRGTPAAIAGRVRVLSRMAGVSWTHYRAETRLRRAGLDSGPDDVLLIVGCQRSGTTLMTRIFEADPNAKVYPEQSVLSWRDFEEHLRLGPLPELRRRLEKSRFPFIVMKPLVESQNTRALLDGLPNARAVWMVRHYLDVAGSNLRRFGSGNGIRNLRRALLCAEAIAAGGADGADGAFERSGASRAGRDDWRGQGASAETLEWMRREFSEDMHPLDAAALFWCARNQLFFDQRLDEDERVRLLAYEALVEDPRGTTRALYGFLGRPYPGVQVADPVRSDRNGAASAEFELTPGVRERCESMWTRLRAVEKRLPSCASSN